MKTVLPKIPCGDQLREAWLEAVDLYAIVTELMSALDSAAAMANNGNDYAKKLAAQAKQEIDNLCFATQEVRDMIVVWQAWASETSTIE